MAKLQPYSPEAIIAANLQELNTRMALTAEQELAHLCELAEEITDGADLTPDFLASLPEHAPAQEDDGESLSRNAAPLGMRQKQGRGWRSVCLCTEIGRRLTAHTALSPELFFADTEELTDTAIDRIAYQRNAFADSAYLLFSSLLESPRAAYAKSFDAVCESVCRRECEYCLLPIENSQEGHLTGFWRLIARYGLRIAATCDVETADKRQVTRFALLRATPISLPSEGAERFFGFSAHLESQSRSADILYAAQYCALPLSQVILNHAPLTGASPASRFIFRVDGGDLIAFLLYLYMEIPDFTPIGFYPHLKNPRKD